MLVNLQAMGKALAMAIANWTAYKFLKIQWEIRGSLKIPHIESIYCSHL